MPESLQPLLHTLGEVWPWLVTVVDVVVAVVASGHVLLYKRDVRAAIGWTGLIWFAPIVGAVAYVLLGINRIRRRAERLERPESEEGPPETPAVRDVSELPALQDLGQRLTGRPLTLGNHVTPLFSGDEAFPAMLASLAEAQRSVLLCTYIFDHDRVGLEFLSALEAAQKRGVVVRVLLDSVGVRYSRPRMTHILRARGIEVAEFLPPRIPLRHPYLNLRNHRKLLLVDGRVAYTGGLNLREDYQLGLAPDFPVRDLHFRIEGPVVEQLFAAVRLDWSFTRGEELGGEAWRIDTSPAGTVAARAVPDGPDEDFEAVRDMLLGALSAARERVRIASPYYLPDQVLLSAFRIASLRGVQLDLLLPEHGNLRFVHWASTAQLWQSLEAGCRIWLSPPPFDHTKLMLVDDSWSFIGSANWDPRSLRLNFELNVECYGRPLAAELDAHLDEKIARSRLLSSEELAARPLPVKLRDGLARLFAPYL